MKTVSSQTFLRSPASVQSELLRLALTVMASFCVLLLMVLPANAHPRKESETEITFNENANRVEIIHRYRIHDSESALHRVYDDTSLSIMTDPRAQALFGAYVEDRFSISRNGETLPLDLVGGEIEDGYIWIYQTTPSMPADGLYVIRSGELMDTHLDQTNIVNVRLHGQTESLIFTRSSPWATFRLDGSETF